MALNGRIELNFLFDLISALDLGVEAKVPLAYRKVLDLADGAGLNQASKVFFDQRQLAASATENLDLAGVLVDALGSVLTFTKIKAMAFIALPTNTNDVIIGNHATAAFLGPFGAAAHTAAVPPGGAAIFIAPTAAGWTVTATTADLIKVLNGGGGTVVDYIVILIGA